MTAYYNEIDKYAAQWLRNLINAGHIAPGIVDERSIEDVRPDDLDEFDQCHFFAGVGVWSLALRHAGWADNRRVWTASCPCQPYSQAGEGAGFDDERHLWPHFEHLLREQKRRPAAVIGEQVASGFAMPWVDLIHADLEALGYAFGCVPFPAAGVGAPHIRDRLYWVANADDAGSQGRIVLPQRGDKRPAGQGGLVGGLANADGGGSPGYEGSERGIFEGAHIAISRGGDSLRPGPTNGFWSDADWLACRDGKWRPVRPGTFPLVNGAASRVGRLRAYGNAINKEQAVAFIRATGMVD